MNTLVLIPARGGSKGVPGKNIKLLGGKPLIYYTIKAAMELFDKQSICVSTDDQDIIEVCKSLGLPPVFTRPSFLAKDDTGSRDVILHAIEYYENIEYNFDSIILLQPTSPFRTSFHIKEAIKLYSNEVDMVVSVKETKSNPYYLLYEENQAGFLIKSKESNALRRQDVPRVWEFNGAIYIINKNSIKISRINDFSKVKKFIMDDFSSHDIDTIMDWDLAELMIKKYEM